MKRRLVGWSVGMYKNGEMELGLSKRVSIHPSMHPLPLAMDGIWSTVFYYHLPTPTHVWRVEVEVVVCVSLDRKPGTARLGFFCPIPLAWSPAARNSLSAHNSILCGHRAKILISLPMLAEAFPQLLKSIASTQSSSPSTSPVSPVFHCSLLILCHSAFFFSDLYTLI